MLWLPVIVVCLGQVGTSGDNSVLSIAQNDFITKLGATMDQVQMANIVYSLLTGALMVFGGMLGIAKGFKKVFLAGLILAALGELTAAFAPTMDILTWGARSFTGIGAALLVPSILGIITSMYKGKQRAMAFGAVGAASGVAITIMPIGAGLIIGAAGYKTAFIVMAIWFAVVAVLAWKVVPPIKATGIRLDIKGTIVVALGLFAFIFGCSKVSIWGLWTPLDPQVNIVGISPAPVFIAIGIIILIFAIMLEAKIEKEKGSALIPQSFLKTKQVRSGLYVTGLIFTIFGGLLFLLVFWVNQVALQTPTQAGLAIACAAIPMTLFAFILPKRFSYLSPRLVVMVGSALCVIGSAASIFTLTPDGFSFALYPSLAILGAGIGCYSAQSAMIVASALDPRDAAQSAGIQCSTRNIWQAAGVAIIGSVMLFSATPMFKNNIANSDLSPIVKQYVSDQNVIRLTNNEKFIKKVGALEDENGNTIAVSDAEINKALDIYKNVRMRSVQYAFISMIIIVLLHIPGFFSVPTVGWSKKGDA